MAGELPAQATGEAAEQRFRDFVQELDAILWEADATSWQFSFVSQRGEKILGYPVQQWLLESDFWLQHIHPEDREQAVAFRRKATAEGRDHEFEYRALTADGRVVWLRDIVRVVRDGQGQVRQLRGLMVDVSESKQTARTREEQTAYLNALIENSPVAIVVVDAQHRVQMCNPAFERLFLYRQGEIVGANLDALIAPGELAAEAVELTRRAVAGENVHATTRRCREDGTFVSVELYGVPLMVKGELIGGYGLYVDITERKQLEEQLRQAQKMEAVGRLAGGIAHDFNNLLTAILGQSELLSRQLHPNDPRLRHAEEIKRAGEQASSLTQQLLAFSRKQVLQPVVLDFNAVVADMEQMLRRLIGEDIELVARLDPALGRVKADPSQLEQVMLNLAVNARDAMPHGGRLTLATANVDLDEACARRHAGAHAGPYVMLAVSDTGIGMDAETRVRVFEPFFTTKEKGKGTGLGLATVYGIVKQSNGHILVFSEPGQGTVFRIYLPRVEEPLAVSGRPKTLALPFLGSETVLVVEDAEVVRVVTRQFLQTYGYTVLEAKTGPEAIRLAQQYEGPIDLLLTDVVMPQMNGYKLAEWLTCLRPPIKVLFMSGYTDDILVHYRGLEESTHFLQKPFTHEALVQKVREILDAEKRRQEAK